MNKIEAARELLLPALRMWESDHPDIRFTINIDGNALLVIGTYEKLSRELGFAITSKAIEDGHYLHQFKPSLQALTKCLEFDADEYAHYFMSPPSPLAAEKPKD